MYNTMKVPVKQPFTFGGVPRSEGGTIPDVATTEVFTDAIYVGDAETLSVAFQVTNAGGTTHALVQYEMSTDFDPRIETGNEGSPIANWVDTTNIVADNTTNDTDVLTAITPTLCTWLRIKFSGAASNGSFNRIRGSVLRQ